MDVMPSNGTRRKTDIPIINTTDAYLNSLIEASPNLVAIASSEGRLLYINAPGRALLGLAESTLYRALVSEDDDAPVARTPITAP